jgi:hypothetical protein
MVVTVNAGGVLAGEEVQRIESTLVPVILSPVFRCNVR